MNAVSSAERAEGPAVGPPPRGGLMNSARGGPQGGDTEARAAVFQGGEDAEADGVST